MKTEDAQRDRKALEIFTRALELTNADARAGYLEGACGADPSLKARVEGLLANHVEDNFLQQPAASLSPGATVIVPITEQPGLPRQSEATVGDRIGRYKLREKVGEGGCGVVYVAEQEEPVRRRVALKVIKIGMDSKSVVARFEAERQALAMMDHPNIARVLDAGTTDTGRPYFVMELVRGIKITDYCDQNNLSTHERLNLFIKVCHAVQHAHQKGIIHRDIKPSNILVTLHDGVPVPKVIDFGIAKATEGRLTDLTVYTELHQFIGTPAYMSPEQAEMSGLDIDTRADIYSLGVLLYELLTGKTPFSSEELQRAGFDEMRRTIREQEPVRPSTRLSTMLEGELTATAKRHGADAPRLVHLIRGDLDWIVMKSLEKDRTRRYETANGLAMDLKRHLDNEPVVARPPSAAYRLQKLVRRNKAMAAGVSLAAAFLILGLAGTSISFIREQAARQRAERSERAAVAEAENARAAERNEKKQRQLATEASQRAEAEATYGRRLFYGAEMARAFEAYNAGDFVTALTNLKRQRPGAITSSLSTNAPDLRDWEWRYLWQQLRPRELFSFAAPGQVRSVAFHPKRPLLAGVTHENVLRVWDLNIRREVNSQQINATVFGITYSPDGAYLVLTGPNVGRRDQSNQLSVLDAANLQPLRTLVTNRAGWQVAFAPNGKFLAGSVGPELKLWEPGTWRELASWDTSAGPDPPQRILGGLPPVNSIVVSADSTTVVLSTPDGRIHLWNAESQKPIASWRAHQTELIGGIALALSPDQRTLATAGRFGAPVWDMATRKVRTNFTASVPLSILGYLAFSPDGRLLAVGNRGGSLALWDTESWQVLDTFAGHEGAVCCVAFSPDGTLLASGGTDGTIRLWNPSRLTPRNEIHDLPVGFPGQAISTDGRHFGYLQRDGALSAWQLPEWKPTASRMAPPLPGFKFVALAGNRHWAALSSTNGEVAIVDLSTQRVMTNWVAHAGVSKTIGISFFLDSSALLTYDGGNLKCWELQPLRERWTKPNVSLWNRSDLVSDGQRVIFIADSGIATVLDAATGNDLLQRKPQIPMERVQFTAITPDFRIIAHADTERIELFSLDSTDVPSGMIPFQAGERVSMSMALTPGGSRVVVRSGDTLRILDPVTQQVVATIGTQLGQQLGWLTFHPGGDVLVAVGRLRQIQIWRAPSWAEIAAAETMEKAELKQP